MKQRILDTIEEIEVSFKLLNGKIADQEAKIADLTRQNEDLKKNNMHTLEQIKEYIKELEKIRNHYVNNNS